VLFRSAKRRLIGVNDAILHRLIEATDELTRGREVERLIGAVALPVARRAIDAFSHEEWSLNEHDIEDILGAISLRLVRKLQMLPYFEEQAIARFDDYVHMLARHSAYDFIRHRFPERGRLRNRLRYLLMNDEAFDLWSTQRGSVGGLRHWKREEAETSVDLAALGLTPGASHASNIGGAVREIFRLVGRPIRFEALLTAVAELSNISDEAAAHVTALQMDSSDPARFEGRESLQILWKEIETLRPLQRAALLLNLREPAGVDAVTLFAVLGIATMDRIAGALGMSTDELTTIFNDLPLDDLTIAERLGVTRQQVINLRKSARARLARRLLKRIKGTERT